jgi:hypothetical protein
LHTSGANQTPRLERLKLNVGDRFRARLETAINLLVDTPIIASVEEAVDRDGERVLRLGDLVRGRASSDGHHVRVQFDSLETKDGTRSISAVAWYGNAEGLPPYHQGSGGTGRTKRSIGRTAPGDVDAEPPGALEVPLGIVFDIVVVDSSRP